MEQIPISETHKATIPFTSSHFSSIMPLLYLKHGANPNSRDDSGLSPLHWAVVRGNKVCIRRLFEKGAEIHAKDNDGGTVRDMTAGLTNLGAWKFALEEGGFTEDGSKRK